MGSPRKSGRTANNTRILSELASQHDVRPPAVTWRRERFIATVVVIVVGLAAQIMKAQDENWVVNDSVFPNFVKLTEGHVAISTGASMLLWGGQECGVPGYRNAGCTFDPVARNWSAPANLKDGVNAPAGRSLASGVWTGDKLIVWGGWDDNACLATGGIYNPATDRWEDAPHLRQGIGAPTARVDHTAVWTGKEMIVWGGSDESSNLLATGGAYDPAADLWTELPEIDAPQARVAHTAIWSGTHMIVWGGKADAVLNTGGAYDPVNRAWSAKPQLRDGMAGPGARWRHSAVWTGKSMVIWGGRRPGAGGILRDGGAYDLDNDLWLDTPGLNTGDQRPLGGVHRAAWTGRRLLVWTGGASTGSLYDPINDAWTAPPLLAQDLGWAAVENPLSAVWTGKALTFWGGINFGGVYTPPMMLLHGALPAATQGTPYAFTFDPIVGHGTLSWSITRGALPAGLTLDPASGAISGTPQAGTGGHCASFEVTMKDSAAVSCSWSQVFMLPVGGGTRTLNYRTGFELGDDIALGPAGATHGQRTYCSLRQKPFGAASGLAMWITAVPAAAERVLVDIPAGLEIANDPDAWLTKAPDLSGLAGFEVDKGIAADVELAFDLEFASMSRHHASVHANSGGTDLAMSLAIEYSADRGVTWRYAADASAVDVTSAASITRPIYRRGAKAGLGGMGRVYSPVMSLNGLDPAQPVLKVRFRWLVENYSADYFGGGGNYDVSIAIDNLTVKDPSFIPGLEVHEGSGSGPSIAYGSPASGLRDFGTRSIHSPSSAPVSFVIVNPGHEELEVKALRLIDSGTGDARHFLLDAPASAGWTHIASGVDKGYAMLVPAGGSATFSVAFSPTAGGTKNISVSFSHDAPGIVTPYYFGLGGVADSNPPRPDIVVEDADGMIAHGATATGARVFGHVDMGGASLPITITVRNTGIVDLDLSPPTFNGPDAAHFMVDVTGFATMVAPGASTSFDLRFVPSGMGARSSQVEIVHNASNAPAPFLFEVTGDGGGPLELVTAAGALPAAQETQAYSHLFRAGGGIAPYAWNVSGTLPSGIAFNAAVGALEGVPEAGTAGTYLMTLTLTDSDAIPASITRDFTLRVEAAPLSPRPDPFAGFATAGGCWLSGRGSCPAWLVITAFALLVLVTHVRRRVVQQRHGPGSALKLYA